jgi:hypothetical protein
MALQTIVEVGEKQLDKIWALLKVHNVVHHIKHPPSLQEKQSFRFAAENAQHGNVSTTKRIGKPIPGKHGELSSEPACLDIKVRKGATYAMAAKGEVVDSLDHIEPNTRQFA